MFACMCVCMIACVVYHFIYLTSTKIDLFLNPVCKRYPVKEWPFDGEAEDYQNEKGTEFLWAKKCVGFRG